MLLFFANFLPQKTGNLKQKLLLGSLANKRNLPGFTNKIKQPIFRGREMVDMFLFRMRTNKLLSHPAVLYLLPQPQSLEAFCQIAVLCKCDTCLSISETCRSVTLTGSLRAEHWILTAQTCSGEFDTASTEMSLLWNSLQRVVLFVLGCSQQNDYPTAPNSTERAISLPKGKPCWIYRQRIIITRCNGIQSIPLSAARRLCEITSNTFFENVFPLQRSTRQVDGLYISSMSVQTH